MKKRVIFKSIISAMVLAVVIICGSIFIGNKITTYADDDQKIVEELTENISFRALHDKMNGKKFDVFNGNGFEVILDEDITSYTWPLFDSIVNAEVKNIKFKNITASVYNGNQQGILAGIIENSTIKGIEFIDCGVMVSLSTKYPLIETGLVAGRIKNSIVEQISVSGCNIELDAGPRYSAEGVLEGEFQDNNLYFGFITGSAVDGTIIKNSTINSSTIELLEFKEELNQTNSIGGLVGYMEAGSIINNMVELAEDSIKLDSIVKKNINVGGLAGTINNNVIEVYNNIVCMEDALTYNQETIIINYGLLIGSLNVSIIPTRIEGVLTTSQDSIIGNKLNNDVVAIYRKINVIERNKIDATIFNDNAYVTYWKETGNAKWNFNTVWLKGNLTNLPSLQVFNLYSASFGAKESLESLKLETLPKVDDGEVVEGHLQYSADATELFDEINDVQYGSSIIVKAKVTDQKNYNKFFSISGLRINGTLVYSIGDVNENIKVLNDFNEETGEIIFKDGYVVFEIANFIASNSGVYSVELTSNKFYINIKVLELTDELERKIIPGKVRNNLAIESFEEINNIEMQYGHKYTYETVITNSDYSEIAFWYMVNENSESFDLESFDYKNEITQFDQTKKFSWTFNENSELFNSLNGATAYDVTKDDASYTLFVAFPQTVRTIEIAFKDSERNTIMEQIAEISIDGDSSRITWDEETGVYTAKVAYDRKNHVIKIEKWLDVKYEFIGWYEGVDTSLSVEQEGTMTGVFKVASESATMEEDLAEILNLHCQVSKQKGSVSLLWLWITIAVACGVLLIVVLIIIIKKRGGGKGNNSTKYKKQFYY